MLVREAKGPTPVPAVQPDSWQDVRVPLLAFLPPAFPCGSSPGLQCFSSRLGRGHRRLASLAFSDGVAASLEAGWFVGIVQHGYLFRPDGQSSVAFYPFYPLVVRAVDTVLHNAGVSCLGVSNVCFMAALVLVHRF